MLNVCTGDTNQRWDRARVDVPAETRPFTLEIQAITYYQADALVALDDISIKPWSCSVSSCKFTITLFL